MKVDIKDIKAKILQLAISGKLVEEDSGDESAELLYEKIQEEKEMLIKEKKIRRINLDEIKKEEIPFDIPESWKWVRLGDVGDWGAGITPLRSNKSYYENGIISWLKTGELNDGYIYQIEEKISQKAIDETSIRINKAGDVLLAMYGATIGKVGILLEEAATNQARCACSVYNGIYNLYLFNYLLSQKEVFIEMGAGGAQPNISRTKIINHYFPLPPLNEQKRIVDKIDILFSLIDNMAELKQDSIKTIDLIEEKVLDLAIKGKLVEQDSSDESADMLYMKIQEEKKRLTKEKKIRKVNLDEIKKEEIPFDIPSSWKWVRLGEISKNIHYGYTASAVQEDTGVKMLRITDIQNNSVDWTTVPFCEIEESQVNKYRLIKNDILIARTGGTIGKNFILNEKLKQTSVFASYLIRVIPCNALEPLYIKHFMESRLYWEQLKEKSQGTGQPNVNATSLNKLLIPLPPLNEQKRIVGKLDIIMDHLNKLREQLGENK